MDYRILGPLEVLSGDRELELGGEKQRSLLAILLLHANEPVPVDTLLDGVWGEQLPPTAHKTLQGYISRLRKTLANGDDRADGGGSSSVLLTRGRGYLLRVEASELDLDRFRSLVEQGREALARQDPDQAATLLREALVLWRGPVLADLSYEAFAQPAIAQFEELRLAAVEERIEADLALGRERDLVGELSALVERNPLRERLRIQLMLALYRCGRQAEALDVFQEYRRGLAQEIGLDPSARLRDLESAILARDPSLERHPGQSAPAAVTARSSRPPVAGRTRWRLALGGLLLIALAMTTGLLVWRAGGGPKRSEIPADSVGAINPAGGAISAVVPVGSSPSGMAAGDGALWVSNYNDNTVSRIDPRTLAQQTIPVDSTPSGIAFGAGAVWVANNYSGTVSWINPGVNRVVKPIVVGNAPSGVAVGFGSAWVTNTSDGTLSRINADTGTVVKTIPLEGGGTDVAAGYEAVWVSDERDGEVLRVDPRSDRVTDAINVGSGPTAITVGYDSVWVANSLDGTVSRINPQTNQIEATIPVGNGPGALAAGAGGVWVANEFGGTITRIDVARDVVATRIRVGNRPRGVAITDGLVWVGAQASDASHRGGTLTALTSTPFDTIDPAEVGTTEAPLLTLYMTNDGLTAFKRVGGTDGSEVVPDLALTLPRPSDDGRTYVFHLRPGIRYSNGQPVKPEDFRRAIERGFRLSSGFSAYQEYYESIIGGANCVARPARCDLSRGIVTNDGSNTVTFHLAYPDPEFLERLALVWAVAVPPGAPNHDIGQHPLPATGPYEIARYSPAHEVTLVRNPHFHEWSHAARPDGYPDEIVWKIGASPAAAVSAVEQGRADYSLDPPPPNRLAEVQTRFAPQLHPNPTDWTALLFLNTRVPPFNNIKVRLALNYAIDRHKVARLIGLASQPTCQLLPPYVPGYQRYCPYTLNPNAAQTWTAPDPIKARSLIAASHTRGMTITIWNEPILGINFTSTGRDIVSLLDSLGYRARLKTFAAGDTSYARFSDPRTKGQAAVWTAASAYTAASEFIQFLFSCQFFPGSNASEFCSRRLDATMQRAFAAEGPQGANTPAAARLWASADRQITDQAPLVPLVTPYSLDFVSARVRNYQNNSVQGALIDQMWVK
jgi:peptide/nickel transport system substrate-binding protein